MTGAPLIVPLPWQQPPVSANDRDERRKGGSQKIKQTKIEARWAVRAAHLRPVEVATVTLAYRVPDRRRRDADNLHATLKICQDALVLEGVLPDDSWQHVPSATCSIHAPDDAPAMWLEVHVLAERESEVSA